MVTLSEREAAAFLSVCDSVVAPGSMLPAIADTDALAAFEAWLARSPRPNRIALRALLRAAPRIAGRRRFGLAFEPLKRMCQLCYYGSDDVMVALGYDAAANVRRGRELRARDGRP